MNFFLQEQWFGLSEAIDRTWVSVENVFEEMPDTVVKFLQTLRARKRLFKCAKQSIKLIS